MCALIPLIHWLIKNTSDEKRGNLKNAKTLIKKRPLMKKEATQKCKEVHQKRHVMKKGANPKTQRGLSKNISNEK
jgi:hypothetical protein